MDLNKITLIGHVVRDPEVRRMSSGASLTKFSLATNYVYQDARSQAKKETVDFHDLTAWGKLGEIIGQYVKKGAKIYVEGRLRNRAFVGKDGQKRSKAEIVADNLIMLGHRAPKQAAVVREEPEEE